MLKFENKAMYDQYVEELRQAIQKGSWKKYMDENKYEGVYFKSTYQPSESLNLSSPNFADIPITSILSCNVSSNRKTIPSNWGRVVDAVEYILNDECSPIAVIELNDGMYYIENGKHRFYAHLLLGKESIPASVSKIKKEACLKEPMLSYNIAYHEAGGMDIAYPEQIEAFFEQYKIVESRISEIVKITAKLESQITEIEESFDVTDLYTLKNKLRQLENLHCDLKVETMGLDDDFAAFKLKVVSVEMKIESDNRHTLFISVWRNKKIVIKGACSSGNETRASKCTCNILKNIGYQVDMQFIQNHDEFILYDKRDAHNINFDVNLDENTIKNELMPYKMEKKNFYETEDLKLDFIKLSDYISRYKLFDTSEFDFSFYSSSFIQTNSNNYYLIACKNRDNVDSIYLFRDTEIPFNNLTIQFLGRVKCGTALYQELNYIYH